MSTDREGPQPAPATSAAGPSWDPEQYLAYADERLRPFLELVDRVGATGPARVVDLGCGPGNATALLRGRWPEAAVLGVDSSPSMIGQAAALADPPRLSFVQEDLRAFVPEWPVDVLVSNATFQWVPGHLALFERFVSWLSPGGWFCFQVPGMQTQPSHALLYELAASPEYGGRLEPSIRRNAIETPETYLRSLADLGCAVDVWETTYYQVLQGPDAVLEWMRGSSLRPFLDLLDPVEGAAFVDRLRAGLDETYPPGPSGTVYPFRRVFVVARAPGR